MTSTHEPESIGEVNAEMETEETKPTEKQGATAVKPATEEKVLEGESHMKEGGDVGSTEILHAIQTPEYRTSDAFFAHLCHAKAETFAISGSPSENPIWICNRDDKVNDVLNGMIKHGFIDLMDIVRYVVRHFGASEFQKERSFFDLLNEEKKFLDKTVGDLMETPLTYRNPYHPIHAGYSSFAVVEALARQRGLHRVPVIDQNRQVLNLVTQSQVVRFLNEHVEALGPINRKSISQCKRLFKEVLHVNEDSMAIDAFNLMVEKNVQGIAIMNEEGRLRGNLSLRDLKIVGPDLSLFWRLHQTVKNFVIKLRTEFQARHGRPRQVVYVTPQSTMKEVIQALAKHQIHRLYICDNHQNKHPVGVVTLQDVLLEIIDS